MDTLENNLKLEEEANKDISTDELLRHGAPTVNAVAQSVGAVNPLKSPVGRNTDNEYHDITYFTEQAIIAAKTSKYVYYKLYYL